MAITTLDGIIAGMQPPVGFVKNAFTAEAAGQWTNLATIAGIPGTWTLGTPGVNGANVTGINALGGAIPFANPGSGNQYLCNLGFGNTANCYGLMLFDLLWYNTGLSVTTTTAQAITTGALAARDKTGTTNGDGVEMWLMATTATTNGSAVSNTTLNYTNQAGTTGRSAGLAYSWPATAVAGTMVPFGLQGSDTGVRAITNASSGAITLGTSYGGGAITLMAIRRIAEIYIPQNNTGANLDVFSLGMPQVFNDSNLYLASLALSASPAQIFGKINFTQG